MSVCRASSLCPPFCYAFGPRSIETGCQHLSPLVASPEGLPPRAPTAPAARHPHQPAGPAAAGAPASEGSSRGRGEKSACKLPSLVPLLSSPFYTFFSSLFGSDHGVGHPLFFVLPHSSSRRAKWRRRYLDRFRYSSKHRAGLLPEKSLRCGGPVRARQPEVVHGRSAFTVIAQAKIGPIRESRGRGLPTA